MNEKWTAQEDRPVNLAPVSSFPWIPVVAVVGGIAAAGWWVYTNREASRPAPPPQAQVQGPSEKATPAEPAVRHPAPALPIGEAPKSLPTLENSDSMMRDALTGLMGTKPFADMVVPSDFIRRIVATVDNLPRPTAPRRMLPLTPVPGQLATAGAGEDTVLDASNYARYDSYVRVMETVDTQALVYSYLRAYPLFQRAYEELGFPGRYFNDRLVEAIDNLLGAPDVQRPVRVVRDKVLYTFVDADLEDRSAGQKILIRMGPDNAARVQAKLREIRKAIARP
jgi:hypothetical protein